MEQYMETYQQVCSRLPKKSDNDGNHPSDFEMLNNAEQKVLLYWIEHAIEYKGQWSKETSYGIKHDFEREGFYITNGQFKGAMILMGHMPKHDHELNWVFCIRKIYTRKIVSNYDHMDYQNRYSLAGIDKTYVKLLIASGHIG